MSASFQAICRPLGFSWTRENYQLNINDTDVGSRKQYLGLLTLLALLCSGNSSEFYFLDELYGNELVFVLSFFSSNNTDVETAEQFILLYTRYVSDFSSPQLWKLKEKIYIVLCFIRDLPGFLLLTHDEFFDAFHWKKTEENKILQRQNCFVINSHRVSSRAVRITSRAVRVFPALSLRRVRPSYGTFFLMVF